ncbi:MAG: MATE family efflux transporter [Bacteroidaceae bacterium]
MNAKGTPLELGTAPIGKLLLKYAGPAIVAMTASSLYNIVDSIFIGHGVGPLALSALALAFPLMNLAAAFGSLVGVGGSTLLSVRLGQKDYESANVILGNVLTLNLIIGLSFTVIFLLLLDPLLIFFGASDETLPYARDFMRIILLGNVVTHMYLGLNNMLRSSGFPQKAMKATIGTVLFTIVLNPIFIFLLGWGIKGSALATIISQVIMLQWQFRFFTRKDNFLRISREKMRLRGRLVREAISIGLAPFFMNAAACVIVILINQGLKQGYGESGDMAIGAYGIVNRVVFIFVMIVMGLNQGMQPIAGYNYGAQQYGRLIEVLKKTVFYAVIVTTVGFLLGQFFPATIASAFTDDADLIALSVEGMHIVMLFFPLVGFQMVASNFFQSIGMAQKAIFLSLTRQLIFLIPCLLFLPMFVGKEGIWYSIPVADAAAILISATMLFSQLRTFKKQIASETKKM